MDDSTLYATVAQVLPLFVLALAAERRFGVNERSDGPTLDAIVGIAFLTSAAIGEYAAFAGLTGHTGGGTKNAAELGLAFAGLFLFGDLVWAQVRGHEAHGGRLPNRLAVRVVAVGIIGVGAVLLLLGYIATL